MAYRRLSLPSLRITQRPVIGENSVHYCHQGIPGPQTSLPGPQTSLPGTLKNHENDHNDSADDERCETLDGESFFEIDPDSDIMESTCYELERKASAAGWAGLRSHMLIAVTEIAAMPLSQVCLHCDQSALYRCQQCGPLVFIHAYNNRVDLKKMNA